MTLGTGDLQLQPLWLRAGGTESHRNKMEKGEAEIKIYGVNSFCSHLGRVGIRQGQDQIKQQIKIIRL